MKKSLFSGRIMGLAIGGLLLTGVLFSACDKDDDDDPVEIKASGLLAANLAPDLAAGMFLSGNNLTPGPLYYTNYTGGYLAIYSGSRTLETFDYNNTANPVASTSYDFKDGQYYSAFVVGANDNYRNVIVQDNFDSLPGASGKAYIRYVNAIPDSSTSMIAISDNGESINSNAGFAAVSGFSAVNAGDVTISVKNGGNISTDRTINLDERGAYTVLLVGMPGSTNADSVQIRYIYHGMLDEQADKIETAQYKISS